MTDETICYMKYNNPTGSLISAIKYTLFLDFGFSYSLYLFVKVLVSHQYLPTGGSPRNAVNV